MAPVLTERSTEELGRGGRLRIRDLSGPSQPSDLTESRLESAGASSSASSNIMRHKARFHVRLLRSAKRSTLLAAWARAASLFGGSN